MNQYSGVPFESNPPPDQMPDLELDLDTLPLTSSSNEDENERKGERDE